MADVNVTILQYKVKMMQRIRKQELIITKFQNTFEDVVDVVEKNERTVGVVPVSFTETIKTRKIKIVRVTND
jgi:hypothetical protein